MLKKICYLMWNERSTTPLRILQKSYARYKKNGMKEVRSHLNREYYALNPIASNTNETKVSYKKWIKKNEMHKQKVQLLKVRPLISIILPVYNTKSLFLKQTIDSVLHQDYTKWELCIADDASTVQETLKLLQQYEKYDERIKVIYREENGHISEASNTALSLATGEYVVFLDHDDLLSYDALYAMVQMLNAKPHLKLIYSDEDKINEHNKRYQPHFKSDWNPDMFFSQNYISHLTLIERDIVRKVGAFRVGYEGSQDYDLFLRCLHHIKENEIGHIAKILYHWRATKDSTAHNSNAKEYTANAGLKAIQDYFKRASPNATVSRGMLENTYKVTYHTEKEQPLVSIVIPTRDKYMLLSTCIESIFKNTEYENYEIIILDNNTVEKDALGYLETLDRHEQIRVLPYRKAFNFSAINNFGVKEAKGSVVCLLNNDVEIISEYWLTELVQHALRPDIGAVGAMLYYDNHTIQHAGVVLGIGGVAGHSHKYFPQDAFGYFSRLKIIQNYAAVTGACLVVEKALYEEVGGLDEANLSVAFNDVDFCLKLQEKGYRNLWTPYVELYHHESRSRGHEDTKEKEERFGKEIAYMKKRWQKEIANDRYYSKHLSKRFEDFSLGL